MTSTRARRFRMSTNERTAAVRRVCTIFRGTTPEQRAAGLGWYRTAWAAALAIGGPDGAMTVAGIIAALSPRCQWSTNVAWASAVWHAARTGGRVPRVHTTTMRDQAWRIANGEPVLQVLHGPKVRAFYLNISGDTDAVTVDVHAVRGALGDAAPADGRISAVMYRDVADVYRRAAARLGVTPRECQAAVWVAVRGIKPTDAGFHADAAELGAAAA